MCPASFAINRAWGLRNRRLELFASEPHPKELTSSFLRGMQMVYTPIVE